MISVVIPLYNKEPIIEKTLKSVLSQDYSDFEVVVVDDGSTDNSVAIVESIGDPRIRLIKQENGGPSKARNTGVKNAKGEWILFLDADDEFLPGAFTTFHNLSVSHPEIELFCCSSIYCINGEQQGEPFSFEEGVLKNPYAALFFHNYAARTGDFMCSRRVALACPFNEEIRRFEDVECLFRMYKKTKVYLQPIPVMIEKRDFAEASYARKDIREDFIGHLEFKGKSFWERMCLFNFFLSERNHYSLQAHKLYPTLYRRYDLILTLKVLAWMSKHFLFKNLLKYMVGKIHVGGTVLLVCAHKQDSYTRNEGVYKAIQVGADVHPEMNLGYTKDNEGDSISERNSVWSEWTAIYWGWKNIKNVEYLGLCHYRRYLDADINEETIEKLLNGKDMLVCDYYKATQYDVVSKGLISALSQEDYWLYIDTVLSIHPDAKEALLKYMYDSNTFVPYSIFVAKKKLYDEFCEFIFPVLFELEKRIKDHSYSRQRRIIGYYGEWSLGLFIAYRKLKVEKLNLVMSGKVIKTRFSWIRTFIGDIKRSVVTWLIHGREPQTDFHVPQDIVTGFRNDGIKLNALNTD